MNVPKHLVTPLAIASGLFIAGQADAQPSFPGAEGFGAGATGGRGGQVIKVTTLAATGPGSLQEALSQPGPRMVVFDVSGVIEGDITIDQSDVTIAGQTAPGGGITIAGRLYGAYDSSVGNIIIRHVRVRPTYDGSAGEQFDGIQLSRNDNVILDHVSVAWGVDETIDMYEASDITVQFCTIEEGGTEGHPEGEHNYGLINGPDGRRVSILHNLFIHQKNRSPAIANGPAEVYDNVSYNGRQGFVHNNPASGPFNIVGNSYIRGGDDDLFPFFFDDENDFDAPDLSYFLEDNFIDDPGIFTGIVTNPWAMPFEHPSFEYLNAPESFRATVKHDFSGITSGYVAPTVEASSDAFTKVSDCAGAFPRDVVTARLVHELESRTGSWGVDAPADLMEGLTPTDPPEDADGDGMADAWEKNNGLDPTDGSDHATMLDGGYTAIETYVNELADALSCGASAAPVPSGGGSTTSGGDGGSGGSGDAGTDDGGCGCRTAGAPSQQRGWPLWLLGLALVRRRRR